MKILLIGLLLVVTIADLAYYVKAKRQIKFLKKEIADLDKYVSGRFGTVIENTDICINQINAHKKLLDKQNGKFALLVQVASMNSALNKFENRMTKAFTCKIEDIQNNMEVMATELNSMKKPVKKVAKKAVTKKK